MEHENSLKLYYIKMASMKIRNAVLKIIVLHTEDIISKLIITLYYMLRTETLPKDSNSVDLLYTINDIKTIIDVEDASIVEKELNKIISVKISEDNNINISDIKNFVLEYKNCMNRITSHHK